MKVQDLTIFRELKILHGMYDVYFILRKWRCIQRYFSNSVFQAMYQDFRFCSVPGWMHVGSVCHSHVGIAHWLRSTSSCLPGYFYSPLQGFFSAPASFDQAGIIFIIPVRKLLNTSNAFSGNYILITYLRSTLHSNFPLANMHWREMLKQAN